MDRPMSKHTSLWWSKCLGNAHMLTRLPLQRTVRVCKIISAYIHNVPYRWSHLSNLRFSIITKRYLIIITISRVMIMVRKQQFQKQYLRLWGMERGRSGKVSQGEGHTMKMTQADGYWTTTTTPARRAGPALCEEIMPIYVLLTWIFTEENN